MKKIRLLALAFSFILSACALPTLPTGGTQPPQVDLPSTAEVFVQQTLQAVQPTPTVMTSDTPVVTTPTLTEAPATATETATETQTTTLLTFTATLGTATAPAGTATPARALASRLAPGATCRRGSRTPRRCLRPPCGRWPRSKTRSAA